MAEVNMPKLSDTMEEGTVLEWKKQDGTAVKKGEVIAEVESDKASFEIEAEADGVLSIVVEQGKAVPVGAKIADIGAAGQKPAAKPKPDADAKEAKPAPSGAKPQEAGTEATAAATVEAAEAGREEDRPDGGAAAADADASVEAGAPSAASPGPRLRASPIAVRLAAEMGVDLRSLKGSGPEGRIVKEDVLAATRTDGGGAATAAVRETPRRREGPEVEIEEPTRMQATIARRMTASKQQVPHFYLTVEARVDEAVRMRQQLKDTVPGAERVTITDFITRACAIALTRFPELNASWVEGHFERKRAVNIGIAVPPAQGLGLLVPVVRDCDRKDLVQISMDTRQVIERARSGKPQQEDLSGGTFSISNLGMYGVDEFIAIINQPEAAILAVGGIKDAPVVEDGQVKAGKLMRMTLSVDHRVFYGAPAAQFMAEVKRLLESPVSLVVPPEG